MSEIYSNADDCIELSKYLMKNMKNKIRFDGGIVYQSVISGLYFSDNVSDMERMILPYKVGLPFYIKFCKDGFLRIQVGVSSFRRNNSMGERLAALSEFYEILFEKYGYPTVFYTVKDDDEGILSLHWSFVNKEEEINDFKNGNYFDDVEIDQLIVIDERKTQSADLTFFDTIEKIIEKTIGLPFGLIDLVTENLDDFAEYKFGKKTQVREEARVDCIPVSSFEEKHLKKIKKLDKENK